MNDELRRQIVTFGQFGITGFTTSQQSTFVNQFRTSGAMNRAIHASPAEQTGIRGIDDGIHFKSRDVVDDQVR